MKCETFRFDEVTVNFDRKRVPLSAKQRSERQGNYRYYGAQGVIDYVDDYIFDGTYLLIAEDGENLKSQKQKIAQIAKGKFWVNNHAHIVQTNERCDLHYLHYYINGMDLSGYVTGSAQPKLSQANLNAITLQLPSIVEQKKIVTILGSLDDKIELNNKINENLEQQAFALFDRLIMKADNSKYRVWDIAYLNPKRPLSKNAMARCIEMSQLSASAAFPSGWQMKTFTGGMRFTNGDTLLARITPCLENGKAAYINFLDEGEVAFGSTEYIVLAPKEGVPPEYLYCLARYPLFIDYAVKNMNGSSGRQRVSADTIGQFFMPCPSESAMKYFGSTVSLLFAKVKYNSFENLRLTSIRDALLPKLMSGEIDVSNVQL